MRSDALQNFALVKEIVYKHGTMSPLEILQIAHTQGSKVELSTIERHLKNLKESNLTWISDQAKAGYLETVRQVILEKKDRLEKLKQEREAIPESNRTKAYYGEVITNTEDSLRAWMEGLPLLMQFRQVMNNENQDTVTITD